MMIRNYLFVLRRWLIASPRFYIPYTRWKLRSKDISVAVPRADTQIVIEAYPRSGNSFAYQAFKSAQPGFILIGHHTHAPASILYAAENNIPALVIVRQPRDAVLSNLIFHPSINIKILLDDYFDFYDRVLSVRDRIVVAKFETVVGDLGKVIDVVNSKFGTDFVRFEHNPDNVKKIFEILDQRNVATRGSMDHNRLARPSDVRARIKEENLALYETGKFAWHREKAESMYTKFLETADI